MAMPHQLSEDRTVHIHGGTGGPGGQSNNQGGPGGVGEGPKVYLDADIMHIVIHRGDKKEKIDITRRAFLDWLSPINFFLRQADVSQLRAKGTGGWLLEHPLYKKWESGSGSTLWCRGIPGSGKTVLVSMVVDHLSAVFRNNRDIGVACIYLNHKEVDNQTPPRLLAGLWRQLVLDRKIGSDAEDLYKQHQEKGTSPSQEEVATVLRSSITELSKVFIIIDAMDEYPEFQREILLPNLAAMGSNVNLLITSRPHISLEPFSLSDLKTLDIWAKPDDLREYINAQICSSRLSQHVKDLPKLQEEMHAKIIGAVDGMFLLAKLHIESLKTKNTITAVRKALVELPKNLDEGYDIAMQRVESQNEDDKETAYSTLMWVANAKRPLSVEELQVALAVEPGTQQLDKENFLKIKTILGVCAGLVIVDEKHKVVRLVHYTTQEYLDKIQAEKFPDAQTKITHTLLTFLAFDGYPDSSWYSWNLPPLVEYSQYCLAHAAGQPEVQLREILLKFLEQALQWRQAMRWRWKYQPWGYLYWPSQLSVLWIAAAANLVDTAKSLLEAAPLPQPSGNPEIIVASYYGHLQMVQLLIKNGADVNLQGGEYGTALATALSLGHKNIAWLLLKNGAYVNLQDRILYTTLARALEQGSKDIAHLLLENVLDVNTQGGEYGTALIMAARWGHENIVQLLLKNGADVNLQGGEYGTALITAVRWGHENIARLLLKNGADVNLQGGHYGSSTALMTALYWDDENIVQLLLENGADVNLQV